MSKIFKWSLALLVVTLLATLAFKDNGRLSMVWYDWVIETSLTFAIALVIVVLIVIYLLIRLWVFLINFPAYWRQRRELKRHSRAETVLNRGMLALEYGDWRQAEKQLIKSAKHSEAGLIHYLSAAKMAQNQGAYDRRDKYLQDARALYPDDYEAIGLVEARLLKEQSPLKSKVILRTLLDQQPSSRVLLAEMAHLLVQLKQWRELSKLLPSVRRYAALEKTEIDALETKIVASRIAAAENMDALESVWKQLSSKQQMQPELLAEYVEQRLGWGEQQGLTALIEKSVKKQMDERLVYQYGRIEFGPAFDRLKTAESWLKKWPNNPVLLLTLGRLACMSRLWGIAHTYFKQSLERQPEVETFHALARCYESEGLETQAALTYKEAILQLEKQA